MSYINSDHAYLVALANNDMAYKASSTYDLGKFLELISNDNDDLSQVKQVIFDPFLDSEENSGVMLFLNDYKIKILAKGLPTRRPTMDVLYKVAEDYALGHFTKHDPLRFQVYLDLLATLLAAGLPGLKEVVLPKVWAHEDYDLSLFEKKWLVTLSE
ncbi:hypothetical protein HBI49_026630 [Parastagonospora nodorum]|nr:hypothetical protein HBI06_183320 [Parastagonospora nodorum]KAH4241025.1 hypothetical protein HBI05_103890 [Parastagonospora nodorum]KAH5378693.1 hypothetical protein HBI49_026630 [Parastagonospora nodorum]KAH5544709.1 hypothetical protein HBI27_059540 [Parastagonospora nodorum]KAH5657431.1 hypothetical protein HBI51_030530 [Parastagonospora nodorum]